MDYLPDITGIAIFFIVSAFTLLMLACIFWLIMRCLAAVVRYFSEIVSHVIDFLIICYNIKDVTKLPARLPEDEINEAIRIN